MSEDQMNKIKIAVDRSKYKPNESEQLMISWIAEGLLCKEIAIKIGRKESSTESLKRELYRKIGVKNAPQCVAWAFRNGHLS